MPYRDDQAALEARRDELRRDLADATRHAEALADAEREKERLARELAAVDARLERAASGASARRLPLLENVRVASPCSASWEAMTGDDRVRFCGSCQKNVYNLSAMASADAERLLAEREGSICVRFYQRADGTVMTTDCPVGVRRRRMKRVVLAVAGAGALAMSASALFARLGKPCALPRAMMGAAVPVEVAAPTQPPTQTPSAEPTAPAWAMGTAVAAHAEAPRVTSPSTAAEPRRPATMGRIHSK